MSNYLKKSEEVVSPKIKLSWKSTSIVKSLHDLCQCLKSIFRVHSAGSSLKKRKISQNDHSLSLVVLFVVIRCQSLSFVVTRCTTRCHSMIFKKFLIHLFYLNSVSFCSSSYGLNISWRQKFLKLAHILDTFCTKLKFFDMRF